MKYIRYTSLIIAGALLLTFATGCKDEKKPETDKTPTEPAETVTHDPEPNPPTPEEPTPNAPTPVTPGLDEELYQYITLPTSDSRLGMYVLVDEDNALVTGYPTSLGDIRTECITESLKMSRYEMQLHPDAIAALAELNSAFIEQFTKENRYLLLVQKSYDASNPASEFATGYALNLRFWDTETQLVYNLGDYAVTKESNFIDQKLADCGFIRRYDNQSEHLRYVGKTMAQALKYSALGFDKFISTILTHDCSTPLTMMHGEGNFLAYSVAVTEETTKIPLPLDTEDYSVYGLNNGYFLVFIPQSTVN